MHARLSLLTATAAVLLATSAMAAPQTPSAASSTAPAASSTAAPAARTTPAASSTAARTTHASAPAHTSNTALYRSAQQKLKDMGLYTGPVDGTRNASFVSALRKYQQDHHLQVSGRLNGQTQRSLGIT